MEHFIEPKRGRDDPEIYDDQSNKKIKESIKFVSSWIEFSDEKNKVETFTLYEVRDISLEIVRKIKD
jgi:hypothetical protein